jgi:DNA sulfur modification protein DndD
VANKQLYDNLKSGLNQETTLKNKIEQTKGQIDGALKKESIYRSEIDSFIKDIELSICVPKLLDSLRSEINLILKSKAEQLQQENSTINPDQVEAITKTILDYLVSNHFLLGSLSLQELVDVVIGNSENKQVEDPYSFLEYSDVKALEQLLQIKTPNPFPRLNQQRTESNLLSDQIPTWEEQIETLRAQISGKDYNLLTSYEANEGKIKKIQHQLDELILEIRKIDQKLHEFDIQTSQEPDPRYEALGKLKPFFDDVANQLLKVKKQQLELKMREDLNMLIPAYENQISRVELSENLASLTFKIFHNQGNEIPLNQLNTASKQIVVQILLKALHEFGDYDPPVMIDTVMGVLDKESRDKILEFYFPDVSHQTILLSSDAEIQKGGDYKKIESFISKSYTLIRDKDKQCTSVVEGYFN